MKFLATAFVLSAFVLFALSGDRTTAQVVGANVAARELTVTSFPGPTSHWGFDVAMAQDGSSLIVRMPMVPTDQGADSSFAQALIGTRTWLAPQDPATGKWNANAHATEDHEISGSLLNVREPLWIVSPWMWANTSITVKSTSLQYLSQTRYKLDGMYSMHLTLFDVNGSTIDDVKRDGKVKLYNLPVPEGGRDISAEGWENGEKITYVLKPSDRQPDFTWGVTVEKNGFIYEPQLVRKKDVRFTYGGQTKVSHEAELSFLDMRCSGDYTGSNGGTLDAYDLSDAANRNLKKALTNLPSDPVDRLAAILNAQASAKVLKRTPAKSDGTILDAHWKLP